MAKLIGLRLCGPLACMALLGAQAPLTRQQSATMAASAMAVEQVAQQVDIDADGKAVIVTQTRLKVLNDLGVRASQFPVPFNALLEEAEISDAYTLKADGRKIPVGPSTILTQKVANTDQLAPFYSDREQKIILFPNVEPGDSLFYTSKVTQKAPVLPGQYAMSHFFTDVIRTDDASYAVSAPAAMRLRFDSTWSPQTERQGDRITYRWRRSDIASKLLEEPLLFDPAATPHFMVSTFADHDAFAHYYAGLIKGKIAVTPEIQKEADRITAGLSGQEAQARAVYEWVGRNIRYVAVELGSGGIIPHDSDWTLTNRFGDCKDHAVLLASLLKAKGIEAQLVLIHAGNRYKLGALPTVGDFNHMIAWLPQLGRYADTTIGFIPFGQLPTADAGKPVLHVVETGSARHQTPAVAPGSLESSYTVRAVMNEQGGLSITAETVASGTWGVTLRRGDETVRALGPEQAAKRLLTQRNFPAGTGALMPGEAVATGGFRVTANARIGRPGPQANVMAMANALQLLTRAGDGPMGPLNRPIAETENTPCFSAHQREELAIVFHPGATPTSTPAEIHLKTEHISYDTHWTTEGDTVTLRREFTSRTDQPVCTGALRREAAQALARIRADYAAPLRLGGAAAAPARPTLAAPADLAQ